MKVEYGVRPVTRYYIHRYEETENAGGTSQKGEYDNPQVAYEVAYALCRADHERLGYPPGDMRIKYPEPISWKPTAARPEQIAAEIDRLYQALCNHPAPNNHAGLYAAQQALCWVMDPTQSASPFNSIVGAKGEALLAGGPSLGKTIAGLWPATEPPSAS